MLNTCRDPDCTNVERKSIQVRNSVDTESKTLDFNAYEATERCRILDIIGWTPNITCTLGLFDNILMGKIAPSTMLNNESNISLQGTGEHIVDAAVFVLDAKSVLVDSSDLLGMKPFVKLAQNKGATIVFAITKVDTIDALKDIKITSNASAVMAINATIRAIKEKIQSVMHDTVPNAAIFEIVNYDHLDSIRNCVVENSVMGMMNYIVSEAKKKSPQDAVQMLQYFNFFEDEPAPIPFE